MVLIAQDILKKKNDFIHDFNILSVQRNIKIIGSAHNQREIFEKISQKCKTIFLSPIFFVKKSKKYLGLHKFNILSNHNKVNFVALGGIGKKNIKSLKLLNIKGFSGISMFKKKTGLEEAGFLKNNLF